MTLLALAVAAWAFAASVFTWVALGATQKTQARARAARAHVERRGGWPSIAILRPCEGLDPDLESNLLSSATARYDGPREVWVLMPSASDPAFGAAERARAEAARRAPAVPFRVVTTHIATPHNRKAAHLGVAEAQVEAPVLVVADSDVHLDDDALPSLVAALEDDPHAAASFAPPMDVSPATVGDHASAALLSSTPHALLALAALSEQNRSQTLLAGALLACRSDALKAIGGFASLEAYLGEDFELARRFHQLGRPVRVSAAAARFTDRGRTIAGVIARYARWSLVVRRQRPLLFSTYFLLLGCTPALLLFGAAAGTVRPIFAAPLIVLLGLRAALASRLRWAYGLCASPLRSLGALLLGESLILAGAALAAVRSRVVWRGRPFRVGKDGHLQPLPR